MYLEKFNLSGRTALITGGSRNIGLACGEALAEAGASVIVADISEELAESGRDHLVKAGHKAQPVVLDGTTASLRWSRRFRRWSCSPRPRRVGKRSAFSSKQNPTPCCSTSGSRTSTGSPCCGASAARAGR